ncbi:MAG: hypothetical protein ACNS60_06590 [Candidatus Cyclobacteriaceae bacterium M2_1C_046]
MINLQSLAQDQIPVITGKVDISIKEGTIDCDLNLKNIPRIQDYVIRINSGMNIYFFKNQKQNRILKYRKSKDQDSWESTAYYFPDNTGKGKYLPEDIKFRYMGKYPVLDSLYGWGSDDWKGNIAFNGYSLRMDGLQTNWYPVLYDVENDVKYEKVKYDIEINCTDCNALYINGNPPIQEKSARFKNDKPYELAVYVGNYTFENIEGTYFLSRHKFDSNEGVWRDDK